MKHGPLRITIIISIIICVLAIISAAFFLVGGSGDTDKQKETEVSGRQNFSEDKNALHQHIIIDAEGKFTLATLDGKRATEQLYDVLSVTDNGMYYFKQGSTQGFIGEDLKRIFSTEDIISTNVSEEFVVYSENNKKGFINITTGEKIAAVYDAVYDFSEGLAAVQMGGATGFINTSGELVIPCVYSNNAIYQFKSGLCNVMTGSAADGSLTAYYINVEGTKVFHEEYDYCMPFGEDRAFVSRDGKWFVIDRQGKRVSELEFGPYVNTVPTVFKGGRAVVVNAGKYGIINLDGQYVVPPKYEQISEISDGGVVFKQNGLFGYMDTNGSVIIAPRYESLSNFKNGLAVFSQDHKYGVIDRAATVVVNAEYEAIELMDNGLVKIAMSNGEFCYINKYGKTVYETSENE